MKLKVSDYIAHFLHAQQIDHVFEMAGGMITHMLDSLYQLDAVNIVSVHHEQSAAFAADAYGRCTGKAGVAMATSGPGATNLLTGIASCYFDSSPGLFITGQVNIHEQKGDRKIRQLGFQETDIVTMAAAITKQCFRVTDVNEIESIFQQAYEIAISGRPGPVLIDIPMNLQRMEIEVGPILPIKRKLPNSHINKDILDQLYKAILQAKKPLILAGGGIRCGRAEKQFLEFVELLKIPVVTSLLAVDSIAFDHPSRVGFIGSYGNRWANIAIGEADLLIVLGSRLDIRQTGADVEGFRHNKMIFHIDCDEGEINNRVKDCFPVVAAVEDFLEQAILEYKKNTFTHPSAWINEINALKTAWPDIAELKEIKGINPNYFMHALSQHSKLSAGYVADVGNHQMWAAQSLEIQNKQFFITSAGMGAMGFALPAAIGASLANQKQPVVVIVGDGCFQLNIQELQTVVRNRIPLKMVVLNNNALGMIRQFQDSYFEGRYQSTYWGYSAPNFEAIANAYGIAAKTISNTEEIMSALQWFWEDESAPSLLQVMIDPHTNVYPKIAFGKPITEMEPFAKPNDMEGT